jgi:hypothetical protein
MQSAGAILPSVACPSGCTLLFHINSWRTRFSGKWLLNTKCEFWFFYKFLLKNSYLEKNSATCYNKFKVAGSIPDGVIEKFQSHNSSGPTMALGSNQPLTEMSTRIISSGVKAADSSGWQPYHLHEPNILKFWDNHRPGALRVCPGLYRDCCDITFHRHKCP